MATYAIGDVQGCHRDLLALLESIGFDPGTDRVWFTGDLVNRGPDSLATLRCVHQLRDNAIAVLGNHDLHLLAIALGPSGTTRRKDTFHDVLAAPDRDELIEWLRFRPLMHYDETLQFGLVHAGVLPSWTFAQALEHAREVESCLRGPEHVAFLESMYGDTPDRWDDALSGMARVRFITNCLTRARYCSVDGRLDLRNKGGLGSQPEGLKPWFVLRPRRQREIPLVFGHWSTLKLTRKQVRKYRVHPLDTGAVWGGALTAMRLDDGQRFSVRGSQPIPLD